MKIFSYSQVTKSTQISFLWILISISIQIWIYIWCGKVIGLGRKISIILLSKNMRIKSSIISNHGDATGYSKPAQDRGNARVLSDSVQILKVFFMSYTKTLSVFKAILINLWVHMNRSKLFSLRFRSVKELIFKLLVATVYFWS